MIPTTFQETTWLGKFGDDYEYRAPHTIEQMNELTFSLIGTNRTSINNRFLHDAEIDSILEIGCGNGNQLALLDTMGFKNLYGVEIREIAIDNALERNNIKIIEANASNLPFDDCSFDMVFTSGLLIHISPSLLPKVMDEMYRCAKKYIWGMEYYHPNLISIDYRGHDDLLWKGNYHELFMERHSDLKLSKIQLFPYINNPNNIDMMYLLEKPGA